MAAKQRSLPRQPVQVRRLHQRMAERRETLAPPLIGGEKQHLASFAGGHCHNCSGNGSLIASGGDHNAKTGAAKDSRWDLLKYDFIPQLRGFPMCGNVLAGSAPGPEQKTKWPV